MIIDNQASDLFTNEDVEALRYFVENEILSQEIDRNRLAKIIISRDGVNKPYDAYWSPAISRLNDGSDIIDIEAAVIVLNASLLLTLNDLKKTLAHEYGHHWTLSYLAINQQIDILRERLPSEYYQHRSLKETDCVYHFFDCKYQWHRCDKEIIAEDYRVLFTPFNQDHRMVNDTFSHPNETTRQYIENLCI